MEFPGFPGGGYDFGYTEAGAALAGLVVRDGSGTPRSGVIPSKASLVTGRSDWNVDVAPFVVVRGDGPRILLGGVDASLQVAISPAPASNSRIDLVWALARNVDAGDLAGCVHVVTGVPGVAPVKPSLPAGGVELATVQVPSTATGTSGATITQTFPFTAAAGGVVPFRTSAELLAWSAMDSQTAVDLSTGIRYQRVLGAWEATGTSFRHFTLSRAAMTDGTTFFQVPTEDTAKAAGPGFGYSYNGANGGLKLDSGVYVLTVRAHPGGVTTGTTFTQLRGTSQGVLARNAPAISADPWMTGSALFRADGTEELITDIQKSTGGSSNGSGFLSITRLRGL